MPKMLKSHPLRPGTTVTVFGYGPYWRPIIEGEAVIEAPIERSAHVYKVRFEGERRSRERLVHSGTWQIAPDRLLSELVAQWKASLTPEHLREYFADEVRIEEARHGTR